MLNSTNLFPTCSVQYEPHKIDPHSGRELPGKKISLKERKISTDTSLFYWDDHDLTVRIKHVMLAIYNTLSFLPSVGYQIGKYAVLWYQNEAQYYHTPHYYALFILSLLRWNLVGLIFPELGRMHFGDEERRHHVLLKNKNPFSFDLQNHETLHSRLNDPVYRYKAPCFQPLFRIDDPHIYQKVVTPSRKWDLRKIYSESLFLPLWNTLSKRIYKIS